MALPFEKYLKGFDNGPSAPRIDVSDRIPKGKVITPQEVETLGAEAIEETMDLTGIDALPDWATTPQWARATPSWIDTAPAVKRQAATAEAKRLGIGKELPGGRIQTGAEAEPRDVLPWDEDQVNVDLQARAEAAQAARPAPKPVTSIPGVALPAGYFERPDEREAPQVTRKNIYGQLSEPTTTEQLATFVPGLAYGYAKEATKGLTGEAAPPGSMWGVGMGETLAQSVMRAGDTEEAPVMAPPGYGDVRDAPKDTWDYITDTASSAWREAKDLAALPLTLGGAIYGGIEGATDRSVPAEERGLALTQTTRNLASGIGQSFERTFADPLEAIRTGPIESLLNIQPFTAAGGAVAGKAGKALTTSREAKAATAAKYLDEFQDGAAATRAKADDWATQMAKQEADEAAFASRAAEGESGVLGAQGDAGLGPLQAERQAMAARRQKLLAERPDMDQLAATERKVAEAVALSEAAPSWLENLLTPVTPEQIRKQARVVRGEEVDVSSALLTDPATLKYRKTGVGAPPPGPGINIAGMPKSRAAATPNLATGKAIADNLVFLNKERAKLSKLKSYKDMQDLAGVAIRGGATGGVTILPELFLRWTGRKLGEPGRAGARWLLQAKSGRVPEEAADLIREAAVAARTEELIIQDAISAIPPSKRPKILEILRDTVRMQDEAKVNQVPGSPVSVRVTPQTDELVVYRPEKGVYEPSPAAANVPEELLNEHLRIANTYAAPVQQIIDDLRVQANALGIAKIDDSSWLDSLYPTKTKLQKELGGPPDVLSPFAKTRLAAAQPEVKALAGQETDLAEVAGKVLGKMRYDIEVAKLHNEILNSGVTNRGTGPMRKGYLALSPEDFQVLREAEWVGQGKKGLPPKSWKSSYDKGFVKIDVNNPEKWGKLAGQYIQEDLAWDLSMTHEAAKAAQTLYSRALSKAKKGLTVWNPGTHGRNVFSSALVMAPMAGMDLWNPRNWKYYVESLGDLTGRTRSKTYTEAVQDGVFAGNASVDLGASTSGAEKMRYNPQLDPLASGGKKLAYQYIDGIYGDAFVGVPQVLDALSSHWYGTPKVKGLKPQTVKDVAELTGLAENSKELQNIINASRRRQGGVVGGTIRAAETGLDVAKELLKNPGRLYSAEDDWFRLAYYRKLREQGVPRAEAADMARRAYVDYEDVAGMVQLLRAPTSVVTPTGARYPGAAAIPLVVGQPFIAYPAAASKIYTRWAEANPIKAATLTPLYRLIEQINYAQMGMTNEQMEEYVRFARGEGNPSEVLTGYAFGKALADKLFGPGGSTTSTTGIKGSLNPIGSFEPDATPQSESSTDYAGRVAEKIIGSNVLLGPIYRGAVKGEDRFGRPLVPGISSSGEEAAARLWETVKSYNAMTPAPRDIADIEELGLSQLAPSRAWGERLSEGALTGSSGYEGIAQGRTPADILFSGRALEPMRGISRGVKQLQTDVGKTVDRWVAPYRIAGMSDEEILSTPGNEWLSNSVLEDVHPAASRYLQRLSQLPRTPETEGVIGPIQSYVDTLDMLYAEKNLPLYLEYLQEAVSVVNEIAQERGEE